MPNDSAQGDFIRSFFEAPENEHLFSQCPFRSSLAHLHEFDAANAGHILAHMLGHFLDHYAGRALETRSDDGVRGISQDNLNEELSYVYNDCNNPRLNDARRLNPDSDPNDDPEYQGFGPEQRACHGADARTELMAEAIRAYLQNPNYLKIVAPNVAARIRAAVNTNSNLNQIVQFN